MASDEVYAAATCVALFSTMGVWAAVQNIGPGNLGRAFEKITAGKTMVPHDHHRHADVQLPWYLGCLADPIDRCLFPAPWLRFVYSTSIVSSVGYLLCIAITLGMWAEVVRNVPG